MKEFIGTYRGSEIFEVDPLEGRQPAYKVVAKARIPGQKNLQVDFIEEGENKNSTVKKLQKNIDRYLEKHRLKRFAVNA